jgi:hypothetical protein
MLMDKKQFKKAIDDSLPTLEYTKQMEDGLFQRIQGNKATKAKIKPILVIAIAMILLFGVAYAATQIGLLTFLFGENAHEASEDLLMSIQPLDVVAEGEGIFINVTGGLYDGERFLVSWNIENKNPDNNVLVEVEAILFDGMKVAFDNATTNDIVIPPPFPTSDNTTSLVSGAVRGHVEGEKAADTPTVQVIFAVSEATGEFIVVDRNLHENTDDEYDQWSTDQKMKISDAGIKIADQDELDVDEWIRKGYTIIDANGYARHMPGAHSVDGLFYERPGQWEKRSEIQLSFSLDRSLAEKFKYRSDPLEPAEVGDYVVQINSITFSPLSTSVDMECTHVHGPYPSEDEFNKHSANILPWFLFADDDGTIIEFTNIDWTTGWGMNILDDGRLNYRMQHVFPGLKKAPSFIVLVDDYAKSEQITRLSQIENTPGFIVIPVKIIE